MDHSKFEAFLNFNDQTVRVVGSRETPLFALKDICNILGIANSTNCAKTLPDADKFKTKIKTGSGYFDMLSINQKAVNKLAMRSNSPVAEDLFNFITEKCKKLRESKGENSAAGIPVSKNETVQQGLVTIHTDVKTAQQGSAGIPVDLEMVKEGSAGIPADLEINPKHRLKINDYHLLYRKKDGFVDVTNLCKAGGKKYNDWNRLEKTKAFLRVLSGSVGIPTDLLIQSITGGKNDDRKTWVHPQVAINIAQWVSPEFDVQVSRWIFELSLTGSVNIEEPKTSADLLAIQQELAETQNKVKELSSDLATEQNMVIRLKKSVSQYCKKFSFYHSFKELPAVYIISDPSKFNQSELKIGFTENINTRLASDRCMIPNLRLEFLMYTPFAVEFEKMIKIRYREQFSNNNHEWLIEPLEDLIKFYQRVNKLLQLNGVEDAEVWKYNMDEQEIEEYEKKNPKKEESIEDLEVVKREKAKIAATKKRLEEMKGQSKIVIEKEKSVEEKVIEKTKIIVEKTEVLEEKVIEKSSEDEQEYESESEDGKELRPYAIGPKTEILSIRLKKILPGWLSKSQYNEKNKKAPKDQRFCNAWCQQFVDTTNYRGIRSGGLLPICKKCENMEDIARIKVHNGQSTIEQIKLNPISLLCNENDQACRQCWKIKHVNIDFEPLNRKCRTCKLTNQKERISNIGFMDTISSLKEFAKTPNLKKIDLELRLKSVSKEEFVLILKELKLGRSSTDKKEDMIQRMVKYLLA
jgi:prophage antirepressor-like protein